MKTASEIFALCGGIRAVATGCGVTPQAVSNWKARGVIPTWHLPKLRALSDGEVTFEDLVNLREEPKSVKAAA